MFHYRNYLINKLISQQENVANHKTQSSIVTA